MHLLQKAYQWIIPKCFQGMLLYTWYKLKLVSLGLMVTGIEDISEPFYLSLFHVHTWFASFMLVI
jgi:hypothetical protein